MMHADAHRSWSVRPLAETDLEAYLDIYLNSYPAYKDLDRACRDHYREKHRRELREDTQTKTVGLFEGANLIATMKLILFSMNFFGQMQPAIRCTKRRGRPFSWCGALRTMPGKMGRC